MRIAVMGTGYVGLVTGATLAASGHDVVCLDILPERVAALNTGECPIFEPGLPELLAAGLASGKLHGSGKMADEISAADLTFICVGTPSRDDGSMDMAQVESAAAAIGDALAGGEREHVVVVKSTVLPRTTEELVLPRVLERSGRDRASVGFAMNPEFLREGSAVADALAPDRIVIGAADGLALAKLRELYAGAKCPVLECDPRTAEMVKYASNAFLATKISFINEIASLCDIVGASIDDVTHGVAMDPRIGGASMRAGVGYGGSCFPKDVRALDYLALTNGHNFELLRSAITVNNRQRLLPFHALRERFGRLSGIKVAVLGLSFKPGTGDMREAPSVDLIQALTEHNAEISTYDPVVNSPARAGLTENVRVCGRIQQAMEGAQAVVVMTEWSEIIKADWEALSQNMESPKFLFDGRNCLDRDKMIGHGLEYQGVGRNGAHRRCVAPDLCQRARTE